MKKIISFTGVVLLGCVIISAVFAPSGAAQTSPTDNIATQDVAQEVFLLKAENNKLVVYKQGESEVHQITETIISSLPQGDILRLEKGVEVYGRENLRKALEDYCS